MADLSLDVNVDPVTAGKIREISKQKEGAVAKEDYDEAKRLKQAIERLKAVGQKVAQLEARKRQALPQADTTHQAKPVNCCQHNQNCRACLKGVWNVGGGRLRGVVLHDDDFIPSLFCVHNNCCTTQYLHICCALQQMHLVSVSCMRCLVTFCVCSSTQSRVCEHINAPLHPSVHKACLRTLESSARGCSGRAVLLMVKQSHVEFASRRSVFQLAWALLVQQVYVHSNCHEMSHGLRNHAEIGQ